MLRPLWIALGILLVLTPLGILSGGSAWGEWLASDFSDPALRQQIAAASFDESLPLKTPAGLDRMSRLWTAPFARYAPPFVQSAAFGYLLSAMFGAGLVILACQAMSRLIRRFAARGYGERTI
jgi:cobalt/nickel transport system permease protein